MRVGVHTSVACKVSVRASPAVHMSLDWARQLVLANATRVRQHGGTTDKARLKHLHLVRTLVPAELHGDKALWMELGVREGYSINFMAGLDPTQHWHGFDSFVGMPSSARSTISSWRQGQLTLRTKKLDANGMPAVRANVKLHKGWFNETIPPVLDRALAGGAHPWVAFMHLDADIYESTFQALMDVCTRDLLRVGTVLAFDELFSTSNLQQTLGHEWRALNDAANRCGFAFKYVSWMRHFSSIYVRVAVRITSIRSRRGGLARRLSARVHPEN